MSRYRPIDRRAFHRCAACALGTTALGLLAASGRRAGAQSPIDVDLAQPAFAPLRQVGGAVKVEVEGRQLPVMLIRLDADRVIGLSTWCTHWGCEVELPDAAGRIECHCHGAEFDIEGNFVDGPADGPLERVPVQVTGLSTAVEPAGWADVKRRAR